MLKYSCFGVWLARFQKLDGSFTALSCSLTTPGLDTSLGVPHQITLFEKTEMIVVT